MKRSEVINIITSYGLPPDHANALLEDLEYVGMLPPFNKVGQVPFNTYDAILEAVSEDFKWEEE